MSRPRFIGSQEVRGQALLNAATLGLLHQRMCAAKAQEPGAQPFMTFGCPKGCKPEVWSVAYFVEERELVLRCAHCAGGNIAVAIAEGEAPEGPTT